MNICQISEKCTGCGICEALCPFSAIRMLPDAHGFLHPTVDAEKCTDCGLCAKKCPVLAPPVASEYTDLLAGYAREDELLSASSSGAVFPVLAAAILEKGGLVFGAAFDRDFNVVHVAAETTAELQGLCSSKYVQSRIAKDCYEQVRSALSAGRWVYFSGMSCQIAALKNYLGHDYTTLITQDTACHSVPSPMVWRDYVSGLEEANAGKLAAFSFRSKESGWEKYQIRAVFSNGKVFSQPAMENPYQKGFIKGLYSRSSCFSCKFKGVNRCSDITLADYWGVKGIQPEAYHQQGTSLVLLHSEKGRQLFEACRDQLQIYTVTGKDAFTFNPAVLTPIRKPARYEEFWRDYRNKPFAELVTDCCKPTQEEFSKEKWKKSVIGRAISRLTR